ncbi:MAG: winged helix-turn-helix domain-containing protein, partial [Acetobacteraceae bacterium]|nr:winged helix-turn-helix domain-containing protein [Acetobacteraceae bacterium]
GQVKISCSFGRFFLDGGRECLLRDNGIVPLRPQSFQVLSYLVRNYGRLVSKAELLDAVWGRAAVTEDSLVQCLHEVRQAMDDRAQTIIITVPRRGYIFAPEPVRHPSSIAVLPFEDISEDGEKRTYFADGLAEELIHTLARLPGMRVCSRSASFRFRGRSEDVRVAGTELGVEALIEGSVRWADARVRITVQLIDAREGTSLWSDSFERPFGGVFALQAAVAGSVAARLRNPGAVAGRVPDLPQPHVPTAEAYHLYLKGRYFWNKRSGSGLRKALCCWTEAVVTDPDYPLPYVGIADAHTLLAYLGYSAPDEAYDQVRAAAKKALSLDENVAEAHVSIANLKLNYDWDFPAAYVALKRALSLKESYHHAHHVLSHYYVAVGCMDESLRASRRALELEPMDVVLLAHIGWHHHHAREYEKAVAACERAIELDPRFAMAHTYLGEIWTTVGRFAEAVAAFDVAIEFTDGGNADIRGGRGLALALAGHRTEAERVLAELLEYSALGKYASPYYQALIRLALGHSNQTYTLLANAVQVRSRQLIYIRTDPALGALHDDPRFTALQRRVVSHGRHCVAGHPGDIR